MSEQKVDEKAAVRAQLDVNELEWIRAEPEGVTLDVCAEYAYVEHDGLKYTAMRRSPDLNGVVLIFTPAEWEAWLRGNDDHAFDLPEDAVRGRPV
jgi:hypothetical protein